MMPRRSQRYGIIIGIWRVARGRADGIAYFDGTAQAFLASLAPLLAFPIVGAVVGVFSEGLISSITGFAMYLCALLTPAVVSYELARRWGRADAWLRFATAFNWCEWILPLLATVLMLPISLAVGLGLEAHLASLAMLGLLAAYGLWLHWFLARRGLNLSIMRAIVMVFAVNAATALAVIVPTLVLGLVT